MGPIFLQLHISFSFHILLSHLPSANTFSCICSLRYLLHFALGCTRHQDFRLCLTPSRFVDSSREQATKNKRLNSPILIASAVLYLVSPYR
ncbi:hypothetical protein BDV32DRAFT_125374 [Aspergillus pseudonomiae]|nr:hypothetical protein BDV32DRAFT_125374 [Aspergillus pseudonomiae]